MRRAVLRPAAAAALVLALSGCADDADPIDRPFSSEAGDDPGVPAAGVTDAVPEACRGPFPQAFGPADIDELGLLPPDFPEPPVQATLCLTAETVGGSHETASYATSATPEEVLAAYVTALADLGGARRRRPGEPDRHRDGRRPRHPGDAPRRRLRAGLRSLIRAHGAAGSTMMCHVSAFAPPRERPTGRGVARVAATLGAQQVLLAATTVVILVATVDVPGPDFEIHRELAPVDLVGSLLYGPLGAWIVVRSGHAVGWIFLAIGAGFGATSAAIAWTVLGVEHPQLPGAAWAPPILLTGWTTATLLSALLLPFLLTPEPPTGWARRFAIAGGVVVGLATGLRFLVQIDGAPPHPLTGGGAVSDVAIAADGALIPVYFLLGLAVVGWLGHRLRAADADRRRGLLWLLWALLLVTCAYMLFEIGVSLAGTWFVIGIVLLSVAEVMLLASVFVLIRREPSWGLDLAISRTLVGLLLTTTLVAAYVVLVWALSAAVPWRTESTGIVVVAALALAVLPLRDLVQRQVDRLVFGSGADPSALLERVAHALDDGDPERPHLSGLVEALRRALRLARVDVVVHGRTVATAGRHRDDDLARALRIELHPRGREIGELLVVAPRGERLDPRSVRLLRQIAGLVAVAAQLDEANREVEQARTRVVEVRQEERRVLRRELHDSLGPALSGTALALAAVPATSALSRGDAALLRTLVEELSRRADDVREMARVLLPPALDHGRLLEALELLAQRHSHARFAVDVRAPQADDSTACTRSSPTRSPRRRCATRRAMPARGTAGSDWIRPRPVASGWRSRTTAAGSTTRPWSGWGCRRCVSAPPSWAGPAWS